MTFGQRKLIVVEDDPDLREVELLLLNSMGYAVVGLADGEQAAETVQREAADLVLLDLMLPRKDGFTVLAELENQPMTAHTPVIVVSAYADRPGSREALGRSRQVKRIIDKPFGLGLLVDAIARTLYVHERVE
jgi:CheY-like chemotaxis protein